MDLSAYGFTPLTIEHKPLIDSILNRQDTMLSAYSFTSHYIWRDHFNFHWGIINGYFCLFAQYGDYVYMPVPPVLSKNTVHPCHSELVSESPSYETLKQVQGEELSPLPGVCHLPSILSDLFNIMDNINNNKSVSRIENIDESWIESFASAGYTIKSGEPEYVYLRNDLSNLKGNAYKSKRAMCNYFEKHYRYRYEPFDTGRAAQCIELYNSWRQCRTEKVSDYFYNAMLEDSLPAHREAINNYKTLELTGRIVIIDNRVEGYIFGFERNKDGFYILLEVANPGIKGLAQFIFREFCKEKEGYRYVNTLGDSGLESLRTVKQSYRPFCLATAFTAYMMG